MMTSEKPTIALEGPCCAGKTTLGKGLLGNLSERALVYVRDYSDWVGGGRFLPPPVPNSLNEEEEALITFLRIEDERTAESYSSICDLIIIDRSIHTLIAHCCAIEQLTGIGYQSLAEKVLRNSSIPLWPDVVLYLDASDEIISQRNHGKFSNDSIYMNANYNAGIRSYFLRLAKIGLPRVIWMDAGQEIVELSNLATSTARLVAAGDMDIQ